MNRLIWAAFALVFATPAKASISHSQNAEQIQKVQVATEAVVAIRTEYKITDLGSLRNDPKLDEVTKHLDGVISQIIFSALKNGSYQTLIEIKAENSRSLRKISSALERTSSIEWIQPNYRYEGESREAKASNDPLFEDQSHHSIIQSEMAWMFTKGKAEIVVAVTDDGVDLDHEDLAENIWINEGEIPNNGIDDDQNGLIDDINGWDFSSGDNNPRPVGSQSHGTHVAGIVAAIGNNSAGLTGTAPKVKVMPIRFAGSGAWTSSVVARAYAYAVDNGARIITTSYNIDRMSDDPIFHAAVEYAYQNQVLHFNSAGNGYAKNPRRQKMDQLILVCSTEVKVDLVDKKSGFSNWGTGVDICAPGSDILSTLPSNRYGLMSGTSMASPNAAAVAALIWSLNPSWTRDQVAAQLFNGAEDIRALNASFDDGLGAGRINSFRSLAFRPRAPKIDSADPVTAFGVTQSIRIRSRNVFRADTVAQTSNWLLSNIESGEPIPLRIDRDYKVGTNEFFLLLDKALEPGRYQLRVRSGGLRDPFNLALDGDSDGRAGGDFVTEFEIEEPNLSEEELHASSTL